MTQRRSSPAPSPRDRLVRPVFERRRRWGHSLLVARSRVPVLNRGWVVAPPDFVGVGVQRAGTSWWHSLIESHPYVHQLGFGIKEVHYFDERWASGLDDGAIERYHRTFARPRGMLTGEWTPRYLFDAWVPSMLREAAPAAKVLVLLRDPIERFRSGLQHAVERGEPVTADSTMVAAARGRYHEQLDRLLVVFPRDQVLALQLERCLLEPVEQLRRTYAFLGLDATYVPAGVTHAVNAAAAPHLPLAPHLTDSLRAYYRDDLEALGRSFPEIDLGLWPTATGTA